MSPLDEAEFESLLDQVRDLHRRTDEITRSKSRLHEHIRSQLRWERTPATVPPEQRDLAEQGRSANLASRQVKLADCTRRTSVVAKPFHEGDYGSDSKHQA